MAEARHQDEEALKRAMEEARQRAAASQQAEVEARRRAEERGKMSVGGARKSPSPSPKPAPPPPPPQLPAPEPSPPEDDSIGDRLEDEDSPAWATAYLASVPMTRTPFVHLAPRPVHLYPEPPVRTPKARAGTSLVKAGATKTSVAEHLRTQLKALPESARLARGKLELELGKTLADLGQPVEAWKHLDQAEALFGSEDKAWRFHAMSARVTLALDMGIDARKGADRLSLLLLRFVAEQNLSERYQAMASHLRGVFYLKSGRVEDARASFQAALTAFARHPRVVDDAEASTWNTLGQLDHALGLLPSAAEDYAHALQRLGSAPAWDEVRGVVHMNLAAVQEAQGQHVAAALALEQSRALFRTRGIPAREAASLNGLAQVRAAQGRPEEARSLLQEALSLYGRLGLPEGEMRTLLNLSQAERGLHRLPRALGCLTEARALSAAMDLPWISLILHHEFMALWAEAGHRDLAILEGKAAVKEIQQLRGELKGLEPQMQRAFLLANGATFRSLSDLLVNAGRLTEAQRVLALMKEEELRDFIRGEAPSTGLATPILTDGERSWSLRYQKIQGNLTALGRELMDLRQKAKRAGGRLEAGDQARRRAIEVDLAVARQAFSAFLSTLEAEPASSQSASGRDLRGLRDTEALQATLKDLGHGAVALHYVASGERLHILVTTPALQLARTIPLKTEALNQAIAAFRQALANPNLDVHPPAQRLYDLLLRPVVSDLEQAGAETLMLSLDGALRYVPFPALWDGKHFAVERWSFALLTEAAKDKLKDLPAPGRTLLAFGVSTALQGFMPLPSVPGELEAVSVVLPGPTHLNQAFTQEALDQGLLAEPQVLHLSSHFIFRPGSNVESFLLIGDGSHLSLAAIQQASWSLGSVELLTLSACETAVGGGKDAAGREVEGLGALLQQKGAKCVLATLWSVADASTGDLMADLYRRWKNTPGITKAESLRQTQLAFLSGQVRSRGSATTKGVSLAPDASAQPVDWSHPYYWAPFILMGNWR